MKTLLATIIGLAVAVVANPASAYMIAITTSIPATSVADDTDLETALESAIDDVLRNAIAFSATFVTVLKAWVVEDRIYILLLIGDSEGEEMMKKLSVEGTTDIKLPDHEEAISPVTILDGQGRVVRVVLAQEFRRHAVTAELSPARTKKYHRPTRTVASVAARWKEVPFGDDSVTGNRSMCNSHKTRGCRTPERGGRDASLGDRAGGSRESCRSAGRTRRGPEQQA